MYHILDQTNVQQSFGYDALVGPYISTIMHNGKFIKVEKGPWIEVYPVYANNNYPRHAPQHYQESSTQSKQNQANPQQSPLSQAQSTDTNFSPSQHSSETHFKTTYSNLPSPHTRQHVPGMSEEELEEKRKEAGWYPGCESEGEEEEPDFWQFIKNLENETEERRSAERLRETEEEDENYFITRFDYH